MLRNTVKEVAAKVRRWVYQDLPDRYVPSVRVLASLGPRQREFSADYSQYLEWTQSNGSLDEVPFHLSFLPLAKNIRAGAHALMLAANSEKRLVIVPGNPWEQVELTNDGFGDWNPWLWSRIPRSQLQALGTGVDDPDRGWTTYFLGLNERSPDGPTTKADRPVGSVGSIRARWILESACAVRHAFRLNEHMQGVIRGYKSRMAWRDEVPKLAIHLRRGDAATEDLSKQTRTSYSLEEYLHRADMLCQRFGIRTIYLSTESESEIEKARSLRPTYEFLSLQHDRSIFPKIAETSMFIEHKALLDPTDIEPIVNSAIADLYFMQSCDAFIGTFNSEFSVLGLLLCIGRNGHIVPYYNLYPRSRKRGFMDRLPFDCLP